MRLFLCRRLFLQRRRKNQSLLVFATCNHQRRHSFSRVAGLQWPSTLQGRLGQQAHPVAAPIHQALLWVPGPWYLPSRWCGRSYPPPLPLPLPYLPPHRERPGNNQERLFSSPSHIVVPLTLWKSVIFWVSSESESESESEIKSASGSDKTARKLNIFEGVV